MKAYSCELGRLDPPPPPTVVSQALGLCGNTKTITKTITLMMPV